MLIRYNIVQGDATTAGGHVTGATDMRLAINGKAIALEGDEVYCPACKTAGRILCVGPRQNNWFHGRKDALNNDLCLCRCDPKPQLINSTTRMSHRISHETLVAQGFAKHPAQTGFEGESGRFDEQVSFCPPVSGGDLAGLPFFIETANGRRFSGVLDEQGTLPRISTEDLGRYEIFWGDDALARA